VARGRGIRTARSLAAPLLIAATLASACGGSPARPQPGQQPLADGQAASVRVKSTKLGRILVDARGMTLYLFTEDRRGRSRCYPPCVRVWPPATVSGRPIRGPGLKAKLTTVRRRDRTRQLVYNGHPLYTLVADTRPGDTHGQGYDGSWFVVSPSGLQIGHGKPGGGYAAGPGGTTLRVSSAGGRPGSSWHA
jgi:predicted lipoprotein with Yx(FWY)xxD motif